MIRRLHSNTRNVTNTAVWEFGNLGQKLIVQLQNAAIAQSELSIGECCVMRLLDFSGALLVLVTQQKEKENDSS